MAVAAQAGYKRRGEGFGVLNQIRTLPWYLQISQIESAKWGEGDVFFFPGESVSVKCQTRDEEGSLGSHFLLCTYARKLQQQQLPLETPTTLA